MMGFLRRWRRDRIEAARYRYLVAQIQTLYRWTDEEASDAAQWLLEQDRDHWRPIDAAPTGKLPHNVNDFRELLRRRRRERLAARLKSL